MYLVQGRPAGMAGMFDSFSSFLNTVSTGAQQVSQAVTAAAGALRSASPIPSIGQPQAPIPYAPGYQGPYAPGYGPQPQQGGMPSWVLPVAVIGGVVLLTGALKGRRR